MEDDEAGTVSNLTGSNYDLSQEPTPGPISVTRPSSKPSSKPKTLGLPLLTLRNFKMNKMV